MEIRAMAATWKDDSISMKHIVMFSGGIGSWAAAKIVAEKHGTAIYTRYLPMLKEMLNHHT
jgi:predicted PP-loop superfamily ATPase